MSESTHDGELAAFEATLARLQPVPAGINIARLLFRAGQLSVLMSRPTPQPEPSLPSTDETPDPALESSLSTDTVGPTSGWDYLRLRREVLARGLDALPPPAPWPIAPVDDVDTLLDLPRGSREPSFIHLKRSLTSGVAS